MKFFVYCGLTRDMLCVLCIRLTIFRTLFCLGEKLQLIRSIVCSRIIFFFRSVRFFDLDEILQFD